MKKPISLFRIRLWFLKFIIFVPSDEEAKKILKAFELLEKKKSWKKK